MAIDTSIYQNQVLLDPTNFTKGYEQGMNLRKMYDQAKKEQDIKEAYTAGIIKNPDGTFTQDNKKTVSEFVNRGLGQEGMAFQKQAAEQQKLEQENKIKQVQFQAGLIGQVAGAAKDQNSYAAGVQYLKSMGVDTTGIPDQFDPKAVEYFRNRALTAKEQADNYFKEQQAALDQQKFTEDQLKNKNSHNVDLKKLSIEEKKMMLDQSKSKADGSNLPIDQKKMVEGLATKNAGKIAIKNQIDAVLGNWDTLSNDQKVAAGRSLLKTLNSTEGADAIGTEEAKRLGSKLEFATGNLFNSNPVQFGRDLEGFKEQAANTSKAIGTAVNANKKIIDQAMSRPESNLQSAAPVSQKVSPQEMEQAFQWAKKNASDPRAKEIMKKFGG